MMRTLNPVDGIKGLNLKTIVHQNIEKLLKFMFFKIRCGFYILLSIHFLPGCSFNNSILAGDCEYIQFEHKPSEYYGPGDYFMTCPDDGVRIRCYHYHRHWICERGDILYWDRRLESAARTACGCDLPSDTSPASPAISGKPNKEIFGIED